MKTSITSDPVNDYIALYSEPELPILHALSLETNALVPGAQMLTGHLAGTFLQFISQLVKPKVILEFGTYTGYSALCLTKGLQQDGVLHTIDIDDRWQEMRNKYWKEANVHHTIIQHIGNGMDVFAQLDIIPDLVFIDADKKNYWNYFNESVERMNSGGVIVVDNVLFHGEVILPETQMSKAAKYIHEFNVKVAEDNRVEKVMIPLRDGMSLFIKK